MKYVFNICIAVFLIVAVTSRNIQRLRRRPCQEIINAGTATGVRIEKVQQSRVEYSKLHNPIVNKNYVKSSVITLDFKTKSKSGLIFYAGSSTVRSEMVAMLIHNGKLTLAYDCGISRGEFATSKDKFNDDKWHSLKFQSNGSVWIDNGKKSKYYFSSCKQLDRVFLGGFPQEFKHSLKTFRNKPDIAHRLGGCVRNFKIDGQEVGNPKYVAISPCS